MKAETQGQFSNWVSLSCRIVGGSSERHCAENKAKFKENYRIF